MSSLSFKDELILETHHGVVLCRAADQKGEPFFHYIMADRDAIEKMQQDYHSGTEVDFTTYGEILISGWGERPPKEYDQLIEDYFESQ